MPAQTRFANFAATSALPEDWRGGVIAIGNFDGVHLGHQAVLTRAVELGRAQGRRVLALTFEPHPRQYFRPHEPLFRLTPSPMKARLIAACGLDGVIEHPFNAALAERSAGEFVATNLVADLGVSEVVIGEDFHFGKSRGGNLQFLSRAGNRLNFGVNSVEAVRDAGGRPISSSRIRAALGAGKAEEAAELLGYRFSITSTVLAGRRLGRTLGYPTANLRLEKSCGLAAGIYAARLWRANGSRHDGVASFGRRPTVEDDGEPLLEVFLFDFSGDLYGEEVRVSVFQFLRHEEKFADLAAMTAQMRRDEAAARRAMAGARPLGEIDRRVAFGDD